jgi:hypothetical protein
MSDAVQESLLAYRRRRYLWWALALTAASLLLYLLSAPPEPPGGGTWLGYALGTVAAALVLWLTAFGIRKRSYASRLGRVQGWLSAHIYLGSALLIVATLHTGFQFGANIHTLAYTLMCGVIASGIFGVVVYLRYPAQLSRNRIDLTRDQLLEEVAELDQKALRVATRLPAEYREVIASARDRTTVGGSAWALLRGADRSQVNLPGAAGTDQRPEPNVDQTSLLAWLADRSSRSTVGEQSQAIQDLMALVSSKKAHLQRLRQELRLQAWLEVWLYVHVPLTFALLAALIAHVVSVFLYW